MPFNYSFYSKMEWSESTGITEKNVNSGQNVAFGYEKLNKIILIDNSGEHYNVHGKMF